MQILICMELKLLKKNTQDKIIIYLQGYYGMMKLFAIQQG